MYTVKPYHNDQGKRIGWAVWWNDNEVIDIWPTKRQAIEWVAKASDK